MGIDVTWSDSQLERSRGPACPRCHCQDAEIARWPTTEDSQSWYASTDGRAICRYCGYFFTFKAAPKQQPHVGPPPISDQPVGPLSQRDEPPEPQQKLQPASNGKLKAKVRNPTVCPQCGGKGLVTKTRELVQYRKCRDCGARYKTKKG